MKLVGAALVASSLVACSLIYDGAGLVGPGPTGGDGGNDAVSASDATNDALDEKAPVVVDGQTGVKGIAIDTTYLYWTTESGSITRRKREGAVANEEMASGEANPGAIAVDPTHVYWTAARAVRRKLLTGGAVETFVTTVEDPAGITIEVGGTGSLVYWSERAGGFLKSKGVAEKIVRENLNRPASLAISTQQVFIVTAEGQVTAVTAFSGVIDEIEGRQATSITGTSSFIFFSSVGTKTIGRWNRTTELVDTILTNVDNPASIACDGGFLYFTEPQAGRIRRLAL